MDLMKLQNGSDVRGVAIEGVEGENVNLTPQIAKQIGCAYVSWLAKKLDVEEWLEFISTNPFFYLE